eukprot:2817205-Rhodomonas_salina.1
MWIKGDEMLSNGVDFLSREGTVDKHDARVTSWAWELAQRLAAEGGMQLSVDWFADANNAKCE